MKHTIKTVEVYFTDPYIKSKKKNNSRRHIY